MALINCPECGSRISDQAEKCPSCAYPINSLGKSSENKEGFFLQSMNFGCLLIFYTVLAIVVFVILVVIFS